MNKNIISLENIAVSFDGEKILNDINLDIKDKEFVTFLGPSGCGKTTTLRIIGGFLKPDSGIVRFDGKEINNIPPYKLRLHQNGELSYIYLFITPHKSNIFQL